MALAPREHPKRVGDVSQAKIMAALIAAGKTILLPFGENTRYDLVIDDGQRFVRVQCKTGRLTRTGVIKFPVVSSYAHHGRRGETARRGYVGQADLFGIYCPENDQVYLVPIESLPSRQGSLRITPPANGQVQLIRWAREFELSSSSALG